MGRVGHWRNPYFLYLACIAAVSWAMLLVLQSELTFFADEWSFLLDRRDWSAGDFLDPHNDHIVLAPVFVYKVLLAVFGMDSQLPLQVVSTLTFVLSAVLLFAYLRRRVGDWLALLGATLILFLGAAWPDLMWPFQIGFSGSIAAGLGALLALDRDDRTGDRLACGLLVLATAFSELAVAFVVGAAVAVLLGERPRIRRLYVALVPLALYALWWLGWGHEAESMFSIENVLESPKFVFEAASQAAAALLGLATPLTGNGSRLVGLAWGIILLVVGIGLAILRFRRLGKIPRPFWIALAIGGSFWFLTAFNASPILREPTTDRYQYPAGVFLLLITAEVLRGLRVSRRILVLASGITALAALSGIWFLQLTGSNILKPASQELRGRLAAIEIARQDLPPGFGVASSIFQRIDARSYLAAVNEHGSPAYSAPELGSSDRTAQAAADTVLVKALGIALDAAQASSSGGGGPSCRTVPATPAALTGVSLAPGEVTLKPQSGADAEVLLARFAAGFFPVNLGALGQRGASSLTIPADNSPRPWRLGLRGAGDVRVCGVFASG